MKIVVQRVLQASVEIDGKIYNEIQNGLLLFIGFHRLDTFDSVKKTAKKIVKLRIFSDDQQKMNQSIEQVHGSILSISQFTLYGDTTDGNRPSFTEALSPDKASVLYDQFNQELESYLPLKVKTGIFQSDMRVALVNDGPVTILLESR